MDTLMTTATTATQIGTQLVSAPVTTVSRLQQAALLTVAFANRHLVKLASATVAVIGVYTIYHLRQRSAIWSRMPRALDNMKTTARKFDEARTANVGEYTPAGKAAGSKSKFEVPENATVDQFRRLLTTTRTKLVEAETGRKQQLKDDLHALVNGKDLKGAQGAYDELAAIEVGDVGSTNYRSKYAAFKAAAAGVEGLNLEFKDTDAKLAALDGRISADMNLATYASSLPPHQTIVAMATALNTLNDTVVALERQGADDLAQYREDARSHLQKMQGYVGQFDNPSTEAAKQRRKAISDALATAIGNIKDDTTNEDGTVKEGTKAAVVKEQLEAFRRSLNEGAGTPADELIFQVTLADGSKASIGDELKKDAELNVLLDKGVDSIYTEVLVEDSKEELAEACRTIFDLARDLSDDESLNTQFDNDNVTAEAEIKKRTFGFNHGAGIFCLGLSILAMGANYALPRYLPNWRLSQFLPR